ncbi:MAG TPA: CHAD domain-containing protein, partial [Puia sp.]|nr:CHAD domain-containing protein [Puia sp.]
MLTVNRQRKYIHKIKKEAAWKLKKKAGLSSVDDLHRFRVSIKKLKSFKSFLNPSKDKKYTRPLKKLFAQSGNIRDLHNADLIEENHFVLSQATKSKRLGEFNAAYQKFASHAADYRKYFIRVLANLNKKINPVSIHAIKDHFKKELTAISKYL